MITWEQVKAEIEKQGVKDEDKIIWIDFNVMGTNQIVCHKVGDDAWEIYGTF